MFTAGMQAMKSTKIGYSAIVKIGPLLSLIVFLDVPYGVVGENGY